MFPLPPRRHSLRVVLVAGVLASSSLVATAGPAQAATVPNGDFANGLTDWTITTAGSSPTDYVNLGVTELAGCTSTDFQNYTDVQAMKGGSGTVGSPPPSNDNTQPDSATFTAEVVTTDPVSGTLNAGNFLKLGSRLTTGIGYDVVHGPAATSAAFAADAGDVINFRWYAKYVSDNFAIVAYLQDTSTCATKQEVLSATGTNPSDMLPAGTGGDVWQNAQVTINATGTYRFVFVSGTFDASGGRAAGAELYIADISAGQAQTITFAEPSSQEFGTELDLTATASSGLAVSYLSTNPSVCTVSGSVVSFNTTGTCTITASQGGDSTYAAAPNVTRSFSVTNASTGLTYTGDTSVVVGEAFAFSASLAPSACTGAITYSLDRDPLTGSAGSYSLTTSPVSTEDWLSGSYTLTSSYPGGGGCASSTITTTISIREPDGGSPPPWLQAYGRQDAETACAEGWNPSWAEWAVPFTGGFTCERRLEHIPGGFDWKYVAGFPN